MPTPKATSRQPAARRLADLLGATATQVEALRETGAVDALEPIDLSVVVDGLTELTAAMSTLLDGARVTPAGGGAGWTSPDLAAIRQAFAIANRDARSYQAKLARERDPS